MRVAVYTLTRDRLAFTQYCFGTLWDKAGYPFDHFVIDNGSEDGTMEWLMAQQQQRERFASVRLLGKNHGISGGSNIALEQIAAFDPYDLIVKVDNDCELVTDGVLSKLVECFEDTRRFSGRIALSPRVDGIVNQPQRVRTEGRGGHPIGVTGIIGGLFQAVPAEVYARYRFPVTLPLARGQDDHFCAWMLKQGVTLGYVEDVVVKHHLTTDGQARALPEYFERKRREEQEVPQ